MPSPTTHIASRLLGRLRAPQLFLLTLALFVIDVIVPDPIPLLDEIVLAAATLCLGSWRRRDPDAAPHKADK